MHERNRRLSRTDVNPDDELLNARPRFLREWWHCSQQDKGVKDNQDFKSRKAPATAMCHTQGDRTCFRRGGSLRRQRQSAPTVIQLIGDEPIKSREFTRFAKPSATHSDTHKPLSANPLRMDRRKFLQSYTRCVVTDDFAGQRCLPVGL